MTYCLNIEGFTQLLCMQLLAELQSAFSGRLIDGTLHLFPANSDALVSASSLTVHPEKEEATVFIETNSLPVDLYSVVIGRAVSFLANKGCEVTVAEV
jgi:hypothetical protein